jgi:F-type H+-transporting ATPase subunit alpha
LNRGQRLQEVLKQPQYQPMSLANEVIVLYAATNGYADGIPVDKIRDWETGLLKFIETGYPEIAKDITANNRITPETESTLKGAIEAYLTSWTK